MIAAVFVDIVAVRCTGVGTAVSDGFVGLLKRFFSEVVSLAKAVEMVLF